jgi:curved DNA-binding protein CbpA
MLVQKKTYYEVLGLTPEVSLLEIKRAYRKLVKSHHPDVDYLELSARQRNLANEKMRKLNEAYETLKDRKKRATYDAFIDASTRKPVHVSVSQIIDPADTDEARQQYLRQIFHPSRHGITKILNKYKHELSLLSQDIYDERLVDAFAQYVDDIENTLRKAAQALSSRPTPTSLKPAELMIRYAIAHAADGLEELRYFCSNYDYNHLGMAGNLFRESNNLSRQALQLTRQ